MKKLIAIFKSLTPYDHFLVFLLILSILKVVDVFIDGGQEAGLHFLKLGTALIVISSLIFFAFKYAFDKKKGYQNALISTLLILLMLSHEDPNIIRGILVIVLLYVSKFFIKYKKQSLFNPIVFAIGVTTVLAFIIPSLDVPPLDWSGIDIRFIIAGNLIPLTLVPISLSLIFNVGRIKKHALALSFIVTSLLAGFLFQAYDTDPFSYIIAIGFIGSAIIIEPKTSPSKVKEQIMYGVAVAIVIAVFSIVKIPNAPILGLLIGNGLYFIYKQVKKPVLART
jgi:hypothetical protein